MIDRKYMAHYVDASFGALTTNYVRLGKDLEEFNIELNPDTETSKNILGESTFKHKGYEESASADPFYAEEGDPLFEKLQEIVDTRAKDDTCKTSALEVHLWETPDGDGAYPAVKQSVYLIPTSYGGDTTGYQIPFTCYYTGERIPGKFDPDTKTFTAD